MDIVWSVQWIHFMSMSSPIPTRSLQLDFGGNTLKMTKVITDVLKTVLQNIPILVPVENVYRAVWVIRCKEEIEIIVEMKRLTMASAMLMIVLCTNLSVTLCNV